MCLPVLLHYFMQNMNSFSFCDNEYTKIVPILLVLRSMLLPTPILIGAGSIGAYKCQRWEGALFTTIGQLQVKGQPFFLGTSLNHLFQVKGSRA